MKPFQVLLAALLFASNNLSAAADCILDRPLAVPPQPDIAQPDIESQEKQAFALGDGSQVFLGKFIIDADGP